ncbi:uncharacterized protein L201_000147 [Kwoniella dendrophila CBS 6074]|uniref:HIG1 domain-containing protein n=1 Tax=Kwoniella dendrophila CBS 6074 TaxID=1295534 RepID=A0AAX4JIM6_9TREE
MPLREADISATPIDDGSLTPIDGQMSNKRTDPNDRSLQPRSPMPKLVLFDPKSGEQETIELGNSHASSILTLEDYKRLNKRTTERGMITGLIGGGVLTYLVKRFMPKTPSRNALSLTFLFSSAFISFSSSRALLVSEILKIRAQAKANSMANGEMSDNAPPSDTMFQDATAFGGNSPRDLRSPENESRMQSTGRYVPPGYGFDPIKQENGRDVQNQNQNQNQSQNSIREELAKLNQRIPQQRTRYPKGRGLEGEVEEENEMRDPYATPGQPRLG